MTIKAVLVRATDQATDSGTYAAAHHVAQRFAAHIDALHVRLDPVEVAVAMSTEGSGGPLLAGIIDNLERDADAGEAKARAQFTKFCSDAGVASIGDPPESTDRPSAMFHVETGQVARWMCAYGQTSDLVVASRGAPGNDAVARSTLEAMLLEAGRPLLIATAAIPASGFTDRIAIAWKATPEAARAVAFAMPFLTRAAEVTILTIEEQDGQRDEGMRLARYLGWHGIAAAVDRLNAGPDGAAATLLAAAKSKSGLLVMGGYGHTRLREWVFGGFTQYALDRAELPVLMAH